MKKWRCVHYYYIFLYYNIYYIILYSYIKYKDNIKLWTRYVDDVLVIWEGSIEDVHAFINEVNNKNKNLQFKVETGGKDVYKRQVLESTEQQLCDTQSYE